MFKYLISFSIVSVALVYPVHYAREVFEVVKSDQPRCTKQGEDSSLKHRIRGEMVSGDCRRVAQYCRALVRDRLERGKLNDEAIGQALKDKDVLLACHIARYFSLPEVQKKMPCPALKDAKYVEWLLAHPDIFEGLAFSNKGSTNAMGFLRTLWLKENGKLEGELLNLAVGAALNSDAYPEEAEEELIAKFDFYKQSHADEVLFSQFKTLKPWEMSIVLLTINDIGHVDDFSWAQQHLAQKKGIKPDNIGQASCGLIPYRDKNKDGVSVHAGAAFYDNKPLSLRLYTEYGGVCGAVSKGSSGFCRAKGIPSFPIGQPGHCALVWKKPGDHWVIGNNVCGGWNWAQGSGPIPWKGSGATILALEHYLSMDNAEESTAAYYCASLMQKPANIDRMLNYAVKLNRKNYPAWQTMLARLGKNKGVTPVELLSTADKLNAAFAEEPAVLEHLINTHLAPSAKMLTPLQLSALVINRIESNESQDIYLRNWWKQAVKEIPELKDMKLAYDHRTSRSLISKWHDFYQKTKIKSRTKTQTCAFLEKTIASLGGHRKTHAEMIGFYLKLLTDWKDNQFLLSKAGEFVATNLKATKDPAIQQDMLDFGIKLGMLQNDKAMVKKYQDQMDALKPA